MDWQATRITLSRKECHDDADDTPRDPNADQWPCEDVSRGETTGYQNRFDRPGDAGDHRGAQSAHRGRVCPVCEDQELPLASLWFALPRLSPALRRACRGDFLL